MEFIDTHTHLYLPEFDNDLEEVISRALDSGVNGLLLPNIDKDSVTNLLQLVKNHPECCYPMAGLHPTSVKDDYKKQLKAIMDWLPGGEFVAIGEIGIDLYWDRSYINEQKVVFRTQLEIAIDNDLPVVIHCRESYNEIIKIIKEVNSDKLRGVFHAFTGNIDQARRVIDMGFMIGIGGIVTFKNAGLDRVVAGIGASSLVLETDSPYLAPTPNRGKRNESANIPIIASSIATLTGKNMEEIAAITTMNAKKLFNLPEANK